MRRSSSLVLIVAAAACGGDRVLIPPTAPSTQAALVLSPSRPAFAHAVDLGEGLRAQIELPNLDEADPTFVSLFDCPLEVLGLPSGGVPLRASSGRAFPSGTKNFRWNSSEPERWTSIDVAEIQSALAPVHLDQDEAPGCNDFPLLGETVLHDLPSASIPEGLVALDDGDALLADSKGLRWILPDSSLVDVSDPLLEANDNAITFGEVDEVLIVQSSGPMLTGNRKRGLRVFGPGPPNAGDFMLLARSPVGTPNFELYVLGAAGLARYDGATWTMLENTPRTFVFHARLAAAWIREGEVVFLPPDQDREKLLYHWRDGALDTIVLPDIPRSLAVLPSGELYVGTENGLFLRAPPSEPRTFEVIDGWSRPTRPIWIVLPLEETLFLSGWSGLVNEYFPGAGYCSGDGFTPPVRGASLTQARKIGTKGEILAVGTIGAADNITRILIARLGRSSALPDRCPAP